MPSTRCRKVGHLLSQPAVGETVSITITDTGVGMYPEVRSRVFDPFFTTKGTAGLGLGLAVSFGIIRRHGGNIDVESQYGKGSQFRITLPLASVAKLELPSVKPATNSSKASVTSTPDLIRQKSLSLTTKTLFASYSKKFWSSRVVKFKWPAREKRRSKFLQHLDSTVFLRTSECQA